MTRPKKEETLAKTKDVHLRMNETEYDLLAERAKANSMTVSDFVRSALDNQKVIIKYEITADVPEIKKLISEFGKIGSNLNQIARYFNQGGILSSEMRNEIKGLHDYIKNTYGYEMFLFRPPMGEYSVRSLAVAQSLGYKTMNWSFAYKDWDTNNQPDEASAQEKMLNDAHGGAIYLIHAVSRTNAAVLGNVIDGIRAKGFVISEYPNTAG